MSKLNKFKKLCVSGSKACTFRKHNMEVVRVDKENYNADYKCTKCKRGMFIELEPAPNGIDIGGEAVALHCN